MVGRGARTRRDFRRRDFARVNIYLPVHSAADIDDLERPLVAARQPRAFRGRRDARGKVHDDACPSRRAVKVIRSKHGAVSAGSRHDELSAKIESLAADSALDRTLRDLAAVREGLILVDSAPVAELTAKLEPLTAAGRPFRHTARELLALSAWRNGDTAAAKRWLDLIATDAETPPGTRARMDVLMTLSNDKART